MRSPRIDAHRLQSLKPSAWTSLLEKVPSADGLQVTAVDAEPISRRHNLTRYLLTLDRYSDPISLIGKETNLTEARFYEEIAPLVPFLTPYCWFSEVEDEEGWIVLDDVPNNYPPHCWTAADVDEIVGDLAHLHAKFWDRGPFLESYAWLPLYLGQRPAENLLTHPPDQSPTYFTHGQGALVSEHGLRSAGRLAPAFIRAATGLQLLRDLGGWPGVLDETHLAAVADLLDDPVPVLQPLRSLPVTLLHGSPSVYHWHLTLFGQRHLLDWHRPSIGPCVCDLIGFVEQFDLIYEKPGAWRMRQEHERPTTEQTIVDSYILRMSAELGQQFNAREVRRAIPAARCLYMLTDWFPQFATWFSQLPNGERIWSTLSDMSDEQLAKTSFSSMVALRPYLAAVFKGFLQAYRTL